MTRNLATTLATALLAAGAFAGIPLQINHQGRVTVNDLAFNGNGSFRFALVDPDTTFNVWTNDNTNVGSTTMPTAAVTVAVSNGIYSVGLGNDDLTNMTAISSSVFDDDDIVLRIWFDDGTNGVQQLSPDHTLTSAPYAFHAAKADSAAAATDADTVDGQHAADIATSAGLVGEVRMWAGTIAAVPTGWLLCNGAAVSRTTYSDLFAATGSIYGDGDGATTFNLPDFRDRSPMGATQDDSGVPKTNVTGGLTQTGGAATHTLAENEMPTHSHQPRSYSTDGNQRVPTSNYASKVNASDWPPYEPTADGAMGATTTTGGGQAHNNLQPYFAISFIIKY